MIEISNITKLYDDKLALGGVSASFAERQLSVICATSGSGKSTLIRIIGGIVHPDAGTVVVDDMPIFDNPRASRSMFVITDEMYMPGRMDIEKLADYYGAFYADHDRAWLRDICAECGVSADVPIRRLTDDVRGIVMLLIGISMRTKYLVCDDIFTAMSADMRVKAFSLIRRAVADHGLTAVVAVSEASVIPDGADRVYELKAADR